LAALLHGSQVVGVSQTLRVEQRAPRMFRRTTIKLFIFLFLVFLMNPELLAADTHMVCVA